MCKYREFNIKTTDLVIYAKVEKIEIFKIISETKT